MKKPKPKPKPKPWGRVILLLALLASLSLAQAQVIVDSRITASLALGASLDLEGTLLLTAPIQESEVSTFLVLDLTSDLQAGELTKVRLGLGADLGAWSVLFSLRGPPDLVLNAPLGVPFELAARLFLSRDLSLGLVGSFDIPMAAIGLAFVPRAALDLGVTRLLLQPAVTLLPSLALEGRLAFQNTLGPNLTVQVGVDLGPHPPTIFLTVLGDLELFQQVLQLLGLF